MAPFYCTIIINIIYIQFLLQTKSQFTQIWYDDMETDNGLWTASGEVNFAYSSSGGCLNSLCTITTSRDGLNAYVLRSTDISRYSSLQLKYDISCYNLEAGDTCKVYYGYDSMTAKTLLATFDPPDTDRHKWTDQTDTLPSSASKSIVYIWLEIDSVSGTDKCYWNNLYLMGTQETSLTSTPPPTSMPTPSPTQLATSTPTSTYTPSSLTPIPSPTPSPTSMPTPSPTSIPTSPLLPTNNPTTQPSEPTDTPTTHTEEAVNNTTNTQATHTAETVIDDYIQQKEPTVVLVFKILIFNGIICCLCALLIIKHKILKKKKRKRMDIIKENIVTNDQNASAPGYKENTNLPDINSVAMSGTVNGNKYGEHEEGAVCIRSSFQDIAHHIEGEEQDGDIEVNIGKCTDSAQLGDESAGVDTMNIKQNVNYKQNVQNVNKNITDEWRLKDDEFEVIGDDETAGIHDTSTIGK